MTSNISNQFLCNILGTTKTVKAADSRREIFSPDIAGVNFSRASNTAPTSINTALNCLATSPNILLLSGSSGIYLEILSLEGTTVQSQTKYNIKSGKYFGMNWIANTKYFVVSPSDQQTSAYKLNSDPGMMADILEIPNARQSIASVIMRETNYLITSPSGSVRRVLDTSNGSTVKLINKQAEGQVITNQDDLSETAMATPHTNILLYFVGTLSSKVKGFLYNLETQKYEIDLSSQNPPGGVQSIATFEGINYAYAALENPVIAIIDFSSQQLTVEYYSLSNYNTDKIIAINNTRMLAVSYQNIIYQVLEDEILCDSSCKSCKYYTSSEGCTECEQNKILVENTCRDCKKGCSQCPSRDSCQVCEPNYYLDGGNPASCLDCPQNCTKCESENSDIDCTECQEGYFLQASTPTGANSASFDRCQACEIASCSKCEQANNSNEIKCSKCEEGYTLSSSSSQQCSKTETPPPPVTTGSEESEQELSCSVDQTPLGDKCVDAVEYQEIQEISYQVDEVPSVDLLRKILKITINSEYSKEKIEDNQKFGVEFVEQYSQSGKSSRILDSVSIKPDNITSQYNLEGDFEIKFGISNIPTGKYSVEIQPENGKNSGNRLPKKKTNMTVYDSKETIELINRAESNGKTTRSGSVASSVSMFIFSQLGSIFSMVFNLGSSIRVGLTIQMIQRIRFVNVQFGRIVKSFFKSITGDNEGVNYDRITMQTKGSDGKITQEFVEVLFFNSSWLEILLYLLITLVVACMRYYIQSTKEPWIHIYTIFAIVLKLRLSYIAGLAIQITFFGLRNTHQASESSDQGFGLVGKFFSYSNFNYVLSTVLSIVVISELTYIAFKVFDLEITKKMIYLHNQTYPATKNDKELEKFHKKIKDISEYIEIDQVGTKNNFDLGYEYVMIFFDNIAPLTKDSGRKLMKIYLLSSIYKLCYYQIILVTLQYLPAIQVLLIATFEVF